MTNTDTTTAAAAPTVDPLAITPTEHATLNRWLKSKKGILRTYTTRFRSRASGDHYRLLPPSPKTQTAAWQPVFSGAKCEHRLMIGERAAAAMPPKAAHVKSRRAAAYRALMRHEAAHAAHTQRDYATALIPLMRRANIPFGVFNLMEDARIEWIMTNATAERFDWHRHLAPPPAETDSPTALFYSLIHNESPDKPTRWKGALDDAKWIRAHYVRTIDPAQTPDTAAALVRALEFAQRFQLSAIKLPPHAPAAPDGLPDPETIPAPAPDAAATIGAAPAPSAPAPDKDGPHQCAAHSAGGTPEDISTQLLRDLPAVFLNFARRPEQKAPTLGDAKRTASELAAMARRAGVTPSQLGTQGHRIHAPAVAVGAEAAFRRPAPDKGPRRLCLIVDMSGSMCDTFREHAAAFVAAALELNRTRALAVDVWFSQVGTAAKLPATTPTAALANLSANSGGEGLSNCMRRAAGDMAAASAVVVYTDGELGDDKLPRRIKGQDIIGAVCASPLNAHRMQTRLRAHFDRALVATTPHQLAREIVRYVLTRPV